jgi:hypothetical protein
MASNIATWTLAITRSLGRQAASAWFEGDGLFVPIGNNVGKKRDGEPVTIMAGRHSARSSAWQFRRKLTGKRQCRRDTIRSGIRQPQFRRLGKGPAMELIEITG